MLGARRHRDRREWGYGLTDFGELLLEHVYGGTRRLQGGGPGSQVTRTGRGDVSVTTDGNASCWVKSFVHSEQVGCGRSNKGDAPLNSVTSEKVGHNTRVGGIHCFEGQQSIPSRPPATFHGPSRKQLRKVGRQCWRRVILSVRVAIGQYVVDTKEE